jgi:TPR repeat protein
MYIVGYSLSHGIVTKYSSPQIVLLPANKDAALPWLKKATKAQIPQAFWELGNIYFDRSMKEEGLDCIRRGAELDEAQCLRYLIQYKDDDAAKVQHLSRLVEENNDNKARLQLAEHYEEGTGCAINPQKAFELVEYVYNHTSVSPYDSSHEDSAEKLMRYLRTGFGCEKDPERAGRISSSLDADNDWMWELLTK